MSSVASFENIVKRFDGKVVLNDLSFTVEQNSCTALLGNNGCGKTTTLNILCNILSPDQGEVKVYGTKVTADYVSYKKKIGIVLSKPVYVPSFSTYEYLKFVCQFQQVMTSEIESRIKETSDFLGLEDIKKPIHSLSSGNQMKVSIAAAFIHNPDFLILDEPFVNLDIGTTENLISILHLLKGKKTMLITSHSLDLLAELCNRFLIIKDGKIAKEIDRGPEPTAALKQTIKELLETTTKTGQLSWLTN
jgi:ABC-2 type transport system ATP-binding protein